MGRGLYAAWPAFREGFDRCTAEFDRELGHSLREVMWAAAGTADAPIVVRADTLGTVNLKFDAVEGFHVRGPFWEFNNLDIEGICAADSDCEHAFHVTGAATDVNLPVVGLNAGTGQYRIFAERTLDAIVDVSGYFAP